jgi:arsenate reductase
MGPIPITTAINPMPKMQICGDILSKKRILFICSHNSARSQMAEALLRDGHGDRYEAFSAGVEATEVNPLVVPTLREIGIDASGQWSKSLDHFNNEEFDLAVTVCNAAHQACPYFPGAKELIHREFFDPSRVDGSEDEKREAFRNSRDEIKKWIDENF